MSKMRCWARGKLKMSDIFKSYWNLSLRRLEGLRIEHLSRRQEELSLESEDSLKSGRWEDEMVLWGRVKGGSKADSPESRGASCERGERGPWLVLRGAADLWLQWIPWKALALQQNRAFSALCVACSFRFKDRVKWEQ